MLYCVELLCCIFVFRLVVLSMHLMSLYSVMIYCEVNRKCGNENVTNWSVNSDQPHVRLPMLRKFIYPRVLVFHFNGCVYCVCGSGGHAVCLAQGQRIIFRKLDEFSVYDVIQLQQNQTTKSNNNKIKQQ
jgi:hypothetical protein